MCLAIPAKIVEIDELQNAVCRVGESETFINASLMVCENEAKIGDYVIVHAGFALRALDEKEAQESLNILREMVAAQGEEPGF